MNEIERAAESLRTGGVTVFSTVRVEKSQRSLR
jgi:hypothetical protein